MIMFTRNSLNLGDRTGTTLVELIVALGIFTVVVLSSVQIFNMVIRSQQKFLASQNAQDDMRYLMEMMIKEVRMAEVNKGECDTDLVPLNKVYSTDGKSLGFLNKNDECVKYFVEDEEFRIERDGKTQTITSERTNIKDISFKQFGEVPASQPWITINMDIELEGGNLEPNPELNFQTTISTRHYE